MRTHSCRHCRTHARYGSPLPPWHCPGRTPLASRPDSSPDRAALPPRPTPVCCASVRLLLNTPEASGPSTRAPAGGGGGSVTVHLLAVGTLATASPQQWWHSKCMHGCISCVTLNCHPKKISYGRRRGWHCWRLALWHTCEGVGVGLACQQPCGHSAAAGTSRVTYRTACLPAQAYVGCQNPGGTETSV